MAHCLDTNKLVYVYTAIEAQHWLHASYTHKLVIRFQLFLRLLAIVVSKVTVR